ncbi:MAG: helix-turn-helix transcriptional regulator [Pseudomonadales bacterium]|nr:helix-turn-helix transcriptional regulator [Pseudomonadales bacterium]
MPDAFKNIQDYMIRRRQQSNLTQEEFASGLTAFDNEFSEIDGQTISRWERAKISPSILRQVLIMQFFLDDPQHILADSNFEIGQLKDLSRYLKLLDKDMAFSHVLGAHPYTDRQADFIKKAVTAENALHHARQIAHYQSNLSRGRDQWDIDNLAALLSFPSTQAATYDVDGILSGHLVLLRIKRQYLNPLLNYQLAEKSLSVAHLATFDQPASVYAFNFYSGTKSIHIDINTDILSCVSKDAQIDFIGARVRSDVGVRTMEMIGAEHIATGQELQQRKEGVKLNGRRYENLSYKLSREQVLASSLSINLSRQETDKK